MVLDDVCDEGDGFVAKRLAGRGIEGLYVGNYALNVDAVLLAGVGEAEGATAAEVEVVTVKDCPGAKILPDDLCEGCRFEWRSDHACPPGEEITALRRGHL
jgi:hypothetical protein